MASAKAGLVVIVVLDVVIVVTLYYVTLSTIPVRIPEASDTTSEGTNFTEPMKSEEESTTKKDVTRENTELLQSYILDTFVGYENHTLVQDVRFQKRATTWIPKENQCPETPPHIVGKLKTPVDGNVPGWEEIANSNPMVKMGSFAPSDCNARFRIAIIIPIRDRDHHLRVLLHHLHPILQRQQLDYTIYAITEAGTGVFNRAKLMNVGFTEANRDREYDCYVFHDVDLLLEDDGCFYWCDEKPREVAYHMNKFGYKPLTYGTGCHPKNYPPAIHYLGGVSMVSHNLFIEANGYSNIYWGWGGEDDDMYTRVWATGNDTVNPYGRKCSFSMIKHEREGSNRVNPARFALLYHSILRMKNDGLNTVRYKKISVERNPLFVNITADIGEQSERMKEFMNAKFNQLPCNKVKMPWE